MGKKIFNILASFVFLCSCGFSQADSSYTVMVDDDNVLVRPTALQLKQANGFVFEDDLYKFQINFDTSPSAKVVQTTKTITINTPYIDISDFKKDKQGRGSLYFDNGYADTANYTQGFPTSICFTTRYLSSTTPEQTAPTIFNIGGVSSVATTTGITLRATMTTSSQLVLYARFSPNATAWEETLDSNFFDGKEHACVFIATTTGYKFYKDGVLVKSNSWSNSFLQTTFFRIGSSTTTSNRLSRVKQFNFDMSDVNAPYTFQDYTAGRDESPSLHSTTASQKAFISFCDYTLNGKVLDASGQGRDATITGNIVGTRDSEIASLYNAFTGQTATSVGSIPIFQDQVESYFASNLRSALNGDGTPYTTTYTYIDDSVGMDYWSDVEFKILSTDPQYSSNNGLVYWVSTQRGALMNDNYETNPASDINAKIYYTCAEYGDGRRWILFEYNAVNARNIYEHAQRVSGSSTPRIGGIVIEPNLEGATTGGTDIKTLFKSYNSEYQESQVYLRCTPIEFEKTGDNKPFWRIINAKSQGVWHLERQ